MGPFSYRELASAYRALYIQGLGVEGKRGVQRGRQASIMCVCVHQVCVHCAVFAGSPGQRTMTAATSCSGGEVMSSEAEADPANSECAGVSGQYPATEDHEQSSSCLTTATLKSATSYWQQ